MTTNPPSPVAEFPRFPRSTAASRFRARARGGGASSRFSGPGYLVSVGYMDPGNWATDIAGGSKFGYTLLSVILISNLMAILLQSLCVRLGVATGRDLAQACRDYYSKPVSIALWILCEIAIVACDLAELLGSALALNLLFGIPMAIGVCLTTLDVLVLLWLQNKGFRYTEAIVVTLVGDDRRVLRRQVLMSQPDWLGVAGGLVPTTQILANPEMLYIAMGILGATVMPHNLYLHSSIVQTRAWKRRTTSTSGRRSSTPRSIRRWRCRWRSSSTPRSWSWPPRSFHRAGRFDVADIRDAYLLLSPLLGMAGASTLFALALLASGTASTLTATLAGQIVMEGFIHIRLPAWLRRLVTRLLALIPALITIVWFGENSTGSLLVLSQVVLSLQLSFAVIPLVIFTSDKKRWARSSTRSGCRRCRGSSASSSPRSTRWLLIQTVGGWLSPTSSARRRCLAHQCDVSLTTAFDTPETKRRHVRRLFATIADRYDLITAVLSYGQDARWKAKLVSLADGSPGERALDLAAGTGDIAFAVAARGAKTIGSRHHASHAATGRSAKSRGRILHHRRHDEPAVSIRVVRSGHDRIRTSQRSRSRTRRSTRSRAC